MRGVTAFVVAVTRLATSRAQLTEFIHGEVTTSTTVVDVSQGTLAKSGYVTYQLDLIYGPDTQNVYTIFGKGKTSPQNRVAHPMEVPPAFQVPAPFGASVGGTNPAFWKLSKDAQFDSWLTVAEKEGNAKGAVSSIGIDFDSWTEQSGLTVNDGAVPGLL
jgi:hypothetical protein